MGNADAELFLRWMQYGALTPFCRNHSAIGNVDQYAWAWGEAVEASCARRSSCATGCCPTSTRRSSRASETGAPVQRPLVFDHQYDPAVRDIDDEYLLGRDLLVAPVTRAGRHRAPGLPAGGRVVRLAHRRAARRRALAGRADADGPDPALRARGRGDPDVAGGAALDRRPPPGGDRAARVRAGGGRQRPSLLQEDDGLTLAAPTGARHRTTFELTRAGGRLTLRAEVDGDGYPEFAREAFELVSTARRPTRSRSTASGWRCATGGCGSRKRGRG